MIKSITVVILCLVLFPLKAQNNITEQLSVFLDCNVCDNQYIRQNLGNVQFVRDQFLGDVHVFFVSQRNGSRGRSYEVQFIGKKELEPINYTLRFSTDGNMTSDEERKRILENLKLGLVRFWIGKGTLHNVSLTFPIPEEMGDEVDEDEHYHLTSTHG